MDNAGDNAVEDGVVEATVHWRRCSENAEALSVMSRPYRFTGKIRTVHLRFGDSVDLTPRERFELLLKLD